jgi:hypothetical protein
MWGRSAGIEVIARQALEMGIETKAAFGAHSHTCEGNQLRIEAEFTGIKNQLTEQAKAQAEMHQQNNARSNKLMLLVVTVLLTMIGSLAMEVMRTAHSETPIVTETNHR